VLRLNKLCQIVLAVSFLLLPLEANQNWFKTRMVKDQFEKAVMHYNEGRYAVAETILNKLLSNNPGKYTTASTMLLMKTTAHLGRYDEAKAVGREFLESYPSSRYTAEIYQTFGDIFIEEGLYESAYRMYLRARGMSADEGFIQKVDKRIKKTLTLNIPPNVIEELISLEPDIYSRSILILTKAYEEIYEGKPDECALTLSQIEPDQVPDSYFSLYEQLLLASYRPGNPTLSFAVIVPLSGENRDWGKSFLKGVQESVNLNPVRGKNISYIIYDNRSRAIETIHAIRTLSRDPKVLALIGPLTDPNALIAACSIANTNIPLLIPNSMQNGLTSLSDYIIQLNSNLDTRGRLAAEYAVRYLGLKNIAILAPADEMGQTLTDAFVQELDQLGVSPVIVEWYSGTPENLRRQFRAIRKAAWALQTKARPNEDLLGIEIDSLDAMFDISVEDFFDIQTDDEETLSPSDSDKVVLETIDGIYMPIRPEDLSYVGTQLPMYNLNTVIIGNEGWQNLDVLNQESIGPHLKRLVLITDHFVRGNLIEPRMMEDPEYQLSFYQGFDSAQLLLTALGSTVPKREALLKRLATIDEYRGSAYMYSFAETEPNLNTALQVIQYDRYQFGEVGFFKGDSLVQAQVPAP